MSYLKDDGRENIMFKGPVAKGNIVIKKQKESQGGWSPENKQERDGARWVVSQE